MMNRTFVDYASNEATTENGALAYKSTLSSIVDQFGKAGNYRGRSIEDVFKDQSALWEENKEYAVKFPFYLRMITRKQKISETETTKTVQRGQGARDESFKRLLWFAVHAPEILNKNLWLLPVVGSWKDLWTLMFLDKQSGLNALNHDVVFSIIATGMKCDNHVELVKKFMPRIKTNTKCKTDWTKTTNDLAKDFANYLGMSYKEYNKFKASGTAHEFQKLISLGKYDKLNWATIPGRALSIFTSTKFMENHNLVENYTEWLDKQPTVKFTGYPYELGHKVLSKCEWSYGYGCLSPKMTPYEKLTIDKQFDTLIERASDNHGSITGNVWCALDTSGSMQSPVAGGSVSALDVCISLGVFFSTLNTGAFHKNVIMFDSESEVKQLSGTFTEMISQIPANAMGSTNFQSVVELIVRIRREHPEIPLEDYPQTLLVVSDMQFNPSYRRWGNRGILEEERTVGYAQETLMEVFPEEWVDNFKFVWWDCTSRCSNVPATIEDEGNYFFSGFDGSIISTLLGGDIPEQKEKPSMEDIINATFDQEIFKQISL